MIDNLSGSIFWTLHDLSKPWSNNVSKKDLVDVQYNLEYLVYSTRRFGVEFSEETSESYNTWFKFWENHFKSMTNKEYNQFIDDKTSDKDISKYMPFDSWKDSLEKNAQKN